ncbi:hypothetical protein GCM10025789_26580 [Tessaracoccus lubricantis]|uniref:Glycosyltransferase subfamily 4-like N-terminal domain-containing protein n=1 Tax=Tessaracoccus lubricantis TaxID=545543 RepID=A0ABP9FL50_9ACTN
MTLRVAIVIDDFFPASGGISRSVQVQLEELTKLGHEATLIAPDRHLTPPHGVHTIACPVLHADILQPHLSVLPPGERRARKITSGARFDVVHSQTERGAVVLAARLARLQDVPHVHTFHCNVAGTHATLPVHGVFGSVGYELLITRALALASRRPARFRASMPPRTAEPDNDNVFSRMDWRSLARIASHVDLVTSPARYMLDNIEAAVGQPIDGRVVPNASTGVADVGPGGPPRGGRDGVRFLSIGRLAREKRLDVVLRAFGQARLPGAELVIVGDGDQRARLEAMGVPGVRFLGAISDREVLARQYLEADALVLGSYRFDVQPMVFLEAAAARLPVLYCDDRLAGGLRPGTSHLVAPHVQALAVGMREMAEPAKLAGLREAYCGTEQGLHPAGMAKAYVEVYEEAIRMPRRHG